MSEITTALRPLIEATPTGVTKLITAWDSLSFESRVSILLYFEEHPAAAYLSERINLNALDDPNAYIRYLAAKQIVGSSTAGSETEAKIASDTHQLVQNVGLEREFRLEFDPDEFFSLDQPARLAHVRSLECGGEIFAQLIQHAIENKILGRQLTEMELLEIVHDYVGDNRLAADFARDHGYDGWSEYSTGKDLECLWNLVPQLPYDASYFLASTLPAGAGMNLQALEEVFDRLSDDQKACVLWREDITLTTNREKIYRDTQSEEHNNSTLRCAAITCNFDVGNQTLSEILDLPPEDKLRRIRELATYCEDLRLCIYAAIYDILFKYDFGDADRLGNAFEDAWFAKKAQERRESKLQGYGKQRELLELELYRIATSAVPWESGQDGYEPQEELAFLAEGIVQGDTWSTFSRMSELWQEKGRGLDRVLLGLDSEHVDDGGHSHLDADAIAERLEKAIEALGEESGDQTKRLGDVFRRMSEQIQILGETGKEINSDLQRQLNSIEGELRSNRSRIWMILVFLVAMGWVLFDR